MDPQTKSLLNSLSCPICNGLVDLMSWRAGYPGRPYNFCCVNNWEHYRLFLNHWDPFSLTGGGLEYETVIVYDQKRTACYEITQFHYGETEIRRFDVDGNGLPIRDVKAKRLAFDLKMFDFRKIGSQEAMLSKVKTVLTFQ